MVLYNPSNNEKVFREDLLEIFKQGENRNVLGALRQTFVEIVLILLLSRTYHKYWL